MCGIVGGVTTADVTPVLLEGLRKLEYRGYDSAGIAVINENALQITRVLGKVFALATKISLEPISGHCGIAHTRWATHGEPSEINAHPHHSHHIVGVVHNGIIENYKALRSKLKKEGYQFASSTDSEIVAHLVYFYLQVTHDLLQAVQLCTKELQGRYAIAVIAATEPNTIVVARSGSPIVIGVSQEGNFIASDSTALLPVTRQFIYLEEGDIAKITDTVCIYNQGHPVTRKMSVSSIDLGDMEKGIYNHYMKKEIFEQVECIQEILRENLSNESLVTNIFGQSAHNLLSQVQNIHLVACGTSYYAALIASYWLEELAGIQAKVEMASEYRYRHPVIPPNTLFVAISQSGETADTLAAVTIAKQQEYLATFAICNVVASSLTRLSDYVFFTKAGPEICVASTKSFTTQLIALLLLTITLGRFKKLNRALEKNILANLYHLPEKLKAVLALDANTNQLAMKYYQHRDALFLGRGSMYPVALEGALKLKEITYIHAEAYPAGELKHGPLAIVDEEMPVIVIAPDNDLFNKLLSNIEEVKARRGKLIVFTDLPLDFSQHASIEVVAMPKIDWVLAPILYVIPLQLFAYHVGVLKGTDVDQPRNLAKSVTVE